MKIKGIIAEDSVNYKKTSLTIMMPKCTFKCDKEFGCTICQNSQLANEKDIDIDISDLIERYYVSNIFNEAVVFQGLEPFDSWEDLLEFITIFRTKYNIEDDIVIYTGYTEEESKSWIESLEKFNNIIIKFGRYIPNQNSRYDEVLGVNLASDNQYAKKIC